MGIARLNECFDFCAVFGMDSERCIALEGNLAFFFGLGL